MVRLSSLGGLLFLVCSALALSQSTEKLSLKEAVGIALQANPEVLSARGGIDAAKGRFWRGVSPPPASLSWNYDYIPNGSSLGGYGERTIEITQSIDFPTTIALGGDCGRVVSRGRIAAHPSYLYCNKGEWLQLYNQIT